VESAVGRNMGQSVRFPSVDVSSTVVGVVTKVTCEGRFGADVSCLAGATAVPPTTLVTRERRNLAIPEGSCPVCGKRVTRRTLITPLGGAPVLKIPTTLSCKIAE
jgi:hypothetical protein